MSILPLHYFRHGGIIVPKGVSQSQHALSPDDPTTRIILSTDPDNPVVYGRSLYISNDREWYFWRRQGKWKIRYCMRILPSSYEEAGIKHAQFDRLIDAVEALETIAASSEPAVGE